MHRWSEEMHERRTQHTQGHSKPSLTTGPHNHPFPPSLLLDSRPHPASLDTSVSGDCFQAYILHEALLGHWLLLPVSSPP